MSMGLRLQHQMYLQQQGARADTGWLEGAFEDKG